MILGIRNWETNLRAHRDLGTFISQSCRRKALTLLPREANIPQGHASEPVSRSSWRQGGWRHHVLCQSSVSSEDQVLKASFRFLRSLRFYLTQKIIEISLISSHHGLKEYILSDARDARTTSYHSIKWAG